MQDVKITWEKDTDNMPVRVTTITTVVESRERVDFSGLDPQITNLEMNKVDLQNVVERKTAEITEIEANIAKVKATQASIAAAFPDIQATIDAATPAEPVPEPK